MPYPEKDLKMDLDSFIAEPARPTPDPNDNAYGTSLIRPIIDRLDELTKEIQDIKDLQEEILEQWSEMVENGYTITRD